MNRSLLLCLLVACAGLGVGCTSDDHYQRLGRFDPETEATYRAHRIHCMQPGCTVCPTSNPCPPVTQSPPPVFQEIQPPPPPPPPPPAHKPCEFGWFWDCDSMSFVVLDMENNLEVGRIPANGPRMDDAQFNSSLSAILQRACPDVGNSSRPIARPSSWIKP